MLIKHKFVNCYKNILIITLYILAIKIKNTFSLACNQAKIIGICTNIFVSIKKMV